MRRRMFCELSPLTYQISVQKGILLRRIRGFFASNRFAETRRTRLCPFSSIPTNPSSGAGSATSIWSFRRTRR